MLFGMRGRGLLMSPSAGRIPWEVLMGWRLSLSPFQSQIVVLYSSRF